jgi:hypothetical protein
VTTEQTTKESLKGRIPESWLCIDCGVHTAPGLFNRAEMESAIEAAKAKGEWDKGIAQELDDRAEVYVVRDAVWKASGMGPMTGCLCIGCLEKRIGHALRPKDFLKGHPLNYEIPASRRLMKRQKRLVS